MVLIYIFLMTDGVDQFLYAYWLFECPLYDMPIHVSVCYFADISGM